MYWHGMYFGMYWYILFLVCIASIGMYWYVLTFDYVLYVLYILYVLCILIGVSLY